MAKPLRGHTCEFKIEAVPSSIRQEVEAQATVEQPATVAEERTKQRLWPTVYRIGLATEPDSRPASLPPALLPGLHLDTVPFRQQPQPLVLGSVVAPHCGAKIGDPDRR